ncbi:MAG TPA: DNA polymerase III subunit alpha [Candidatus Glassbacteria bacterium]|nr:DNA polymerase III subunit alpha [Candidatus Glassbacteria bacterium]
MKNSFCHLHIHSEYSQLDGLGTIDGYTNKASEIGFKYLGLTDHGNMDGLIRFQKSCKQNGIKPILGSELYIVPEIKQGKDKSKKRGHICVFVKNQTGFENLCRLLTFANLGGFYYKPRVTYDKILEHCKGLVISTACIQSFVRVFEDGEILFGKLQDIIGEDLYCEIMPHNDKLQIKTNELKVKIAKRYGCKIIATNDCHYINRADHKAHEVLLAIQRKAKWNDPKRWKFNIKDLYLKSPNEMKASLKKIGFYKKEYLSNTLEIAEKCSEFTIKKQEVKLPRVKGIPINSKREKAFLFKLCEKGFKEKFGFDIHKNKIYRKRLEEEYDLITKKKFHRYFLIVWELVKWCKENNILVGPGRGSVGGSLMAFTLGITSVDPIKHNLIFSRFITEDRIDYPDIDIDFEHTKRHLVKSHLESMYGNDKVAGVSSFNRMKARAVIKDVARVFDIHHSETNEFTKLIEDNDEGTGIQQAIDNWDEAKDFAIKYPKVVKYAKALEGIVRGYSQHAAALVISREEIGDCGRCNLLKRDDNILVNWEKSDTEYVGFMKLDTLGLKLLSILSETKRLIKESHNIEFNFEKINLDDKEVLKEINDGNTVGIFQLGTYATTNLIKEMGIEKFEHISDAVALVRPGPTNSGMTKDYIKRKHGYNWERKHKIYEDITKDTYGLLIYQEQIMSVISKVAGLSYTTADNIRKIIGKKRDRKEFKQYEKEFLNGAKKTKVFSPQESKEFWKGLQEWSLYGFNKSHSVEYAMLGYWSAYLKKYYPTEFICASLTYGAKEKKKELVEEAYRLGLNIILPKVNKSDPFRWIANGKNLHVPFIEVKGIGNVKAQEAASLNKLDNSNIRTFMEEKGEKKIVAKRQGAMGKLMEKIGAYDQSHQTQVEEIVRDYFDFRVVADPKKNYSNIYKIFDDNLRLDQLDMALNGEYKILKKLSKRKTLIKQKTFKGHKKLSQCSVCKLRKECTFPVPPSPGKLNIMIVAEAPGPKEDETGKGLIGPSGELLWKSIGKKKYPRELFHVTNCNKCYPKNSGKPSYEEIKICGKFLSVEIKRVKPVLILALGNTPLYYFTGNKSGITNISGKIEWNELYSAWIVWCVHPAFVLHNPDNKHYLTTGIKQFKRAIRSLDVKISTKI